MLAPSVAFSISLCLVSGPDVVEAIELRSVRAVAMAEAAADAEENAAKLAREREKQERREAAERAERAARERREAQTPEPPVSTVPAGSPRAYARSLVPAAQFGCLDALWTRESNWRWNATNPTSGAYGIPQALPASKMASAGADWRTNYRTQVNWGLSYIKSRYGTPCVAWAHSENVGWY